MNTNDKLNGLSLLLSDLLGDLTADGRMTEDEAETWERAASAILRDDPELATSNGAVILEAERAALSADVDDAIPDRE